LATSDKAQNRQGPVQITELAILLLETADR
jgi:hypothetical protein